jgi:hypothetical protein
LWFLGLKARERPSFWQRHRVVGGNFEAGKLEKSHLLERIYYRGTGDKAGEVVIRLDILV